MSVPGPGVLDAFGVDGNGIPLPGGEGRRVRVGDAVLKPVDADPEFAHWLAGVMDSIVEDGFASAERHGQQVLQAMPHVVSGQVGPAG